MTLVLLLLLQQQPPAEPGFADPERQAAPKQQADPEKPVPPSKPASSSSRRKPPRVTPPQPMLPEVPDPDVVQRGQPDAINTPPPVASIEPASVAAPPPLSRESQMTSLEKMMLRSDSAVSLNTIIDELLDELVAKLAKQDNRLISPMAIRWIKISPLLRADLAQSIDTRLTARLVEKTEVTQVVCTDCRSLRSRIEGREWVVSLGVVHQSDLRRVAEDIGARTFIDIDLDYTPAPPQTQVILSARVFRASDARVLFATAIRADETTAAVLRTGKKPVSREEQLAELERKLESRPFYGIQAAIGMMWIPFDEKLQGTIGGAAIGGSAYERFGTDRRHMYGIEVKGFLNPNRLIAGMLSAFYGYQVTEPDLNKPEIDLSWSGGAFIASGQSNQGNSVLFQSNIDVIMRWRFSFGGGITYLIPTKYSDGSPDCPMQGSAPMAPAGCDLGGLGVQTRFGFNW